ncbi:hypothetical protein OG900_25495 [Streptomyces sp. NBC_00433]
MHAVPTELLPIWAVTALGRLGGRFRLLGDGAQHALGRFAYTFAVPPGPAASSGGPDPVAPPCGPDALLPNGPLGQREAEPGRRRCGGRATGLALANHAT